MRTGALALKICHVDGSVERDRDHLHEGILPLFARQFLGAIDVVRDREQAERALAGAGGVHIQAGGLHLNGEDAHLLPLVGPVGAVVVEIVGGEDVADVQLHAVVAELLFIDDAVIPGADNAVPV